jgi:WD40 repeat protein
VIEPSRRPRVAVDRDHGMVDDDELGPTPEGTRTLDSSSAAGVGPGGDPLRVRTRARYGIEREHARGGIGRVLVAKDLELGRTIAVKELLVPEPQAERRFVREALITARLEHPSIVPIHDAGRWETGEPFYAMKLVSGRTLKELVEEKRAFADRLALLPHVIAVTEAIAYAHEKGVLHRDLKPSNVIVGAFGETVVIDWGLAKRIDEADDAPAIDLQRAGAETAELTRTGAVLGTPLYMPPEQASGEAVDERADVYALGAILYFVLSGEHPYEGRSNADILEKVRHEPPDPVDRRQPEVPRDLSAIVSKAMARSQSDRYPTAKELAKDLQSFRDGQLVRAHDYTLGQLALRWIRKNRALVSATALFAAVLAFGAISFVARERELRSEADRQSVRLLEERGRAELLAGRPFQAAVYLAEAYRMEPENRRLRAWASQAIRPLSMDRGTLEGHSHDVVSVEYGRDPTRILTSSSDGTARIWDVSSMRELFVLSGHPRWIQWAVWSPGGERVLTGGNDKTVRLWSAKDGAHLATYEERDPYRLGWSPDGAWWVAGGHDGELRFHDASTGALIETSNVHTDRIYAIVMSPDGRRMGIGGFDGTVSVWDTAARKLMFVVRDHEGEVSSVAFSADGQWMLTAEADIYVHLRRASDGSRVRTFRLPEGARWSTVSFSNDGLEVWARSFDAVVRIYHAASGTLLDAVDVQPKGKLFHSAIRPDGREMVTVGHAGTVRVWSIPEDRGYRILPRPFGGRTHVHPSAIDRARDRFVTAETDGRVTVWSGTTAIASQVVPGDAYSIAADDRGRIAVAGAAQGSFPPKLLDMESGEAQELRGHERMVYNLAASRDGRVIATCGYEGEIRIWIDGKVVQTMKVDTVRLASVGLSADGELAVAGNENGLVHLIDWRKGEIARTFRAHGSWVQDVELDAAGRRLVTAGRQDHTFKVWDVASGRALFEIVGHSDNMSRASFSPDGRHVATCGLDHLAKIWDAATGDHLRTIRGASYTCEVTEDGKRLFTTGYHGYAVIWDLETDERSASEIARYVGERSPWRLADGRLLPK